MSQPSRFLACARRAPTQRRGQDRVARLLGAAVDEFAEAGYESATMSGIARRAKSPIGSLYQFFPNKEAVARALRTRQIEDVESLLAPLQEVAESRSLTRFVDRYVAVMIEFVRTHPAFLPLLDAPRSTVPLGPRNRLRELLAILLGLLAPGLTADRARRCSEVVLNVNKALMGLYAGSSAQDRRWITDDYRSVVRGYLAVRIPARRRARRTRKPKGGS